MGPFRSVLVLIAISHCWVQGQCGASYAFSAMGALEGAWALANGKLTPLSEQNIIDCSSMKSSAVIIAYCYTIQSLVQFCITFIF